MSSVLARRCDSPESHSQHVARLAIRLFDQTKPLHGLGQREREWLEFAAHSPRYRLSDQRPANITSMRTISSSTAIFGVYRGGDRDHGQHRTLSSPGVCPDTDHAALKALPREHPAHRRNCSARFSGSPMPWIVAVLPWCRDIEDTEWKDGCHSRQDVGRCGARNVGGAESDGSV